MATLNLPEPVTAGLTKIATLSNETFQELVSAFRKIPTRLLQNKIFDDDVLFELKAIPVDDLTTIRDTVFSLYIGRIASNAPTSIFVDQVIESLEAASPLFVNDLDQLKKRVFQLLTIESLEAVAKAHDLLTEHSRIFNFSRIVSQIRPIFGEKLDNLPSSAVIEHMLTVSYSQAGRRNEFVMGLDSADIKQLMETLNRAQAEAEGLKALHSNGCPISY